MAIISEISHSKPWVTDDDTEYILSVLKSGKIATGDAVKCFEAEVGSYIGLEEGVCCSSGSLALQLELRVLGATEDDEVIFPAYVF